jgi:hypothetical protein
MKYLNLKWLLVEYLVEAFLVQLELHPSKSPQGTLEVLMCKFLNLKLNPNPNQQHFTYLPQYYLVTKDHRNTNNSMKTTNNTTDCYAKFLIIL